MKRCLIIISVFLLGFLKVYLYGPFPKKNNNEITGPENTSDTISLVDDYEKSDPKSVADYFSHNILSNPVKAYMSMDDKFKDVTDMESFINFRNMTLPASSDVISNQFVQVEHGFINEGGIESSEYVYHINAKDDFQPHVKLTIDIFKANEEYRVLRYSISTLYDQDVSVK